MEAKIYINEKIFKDISESPERVIQGVAFEIRGEGIIHTFLEYPEVNPKGIPLPVIFMKDEKSEINLPKPNFQGWGTKVLYVFCNPKGKMKAELFEFGEKQKITIDIEIIALSKDLQSRNAGIIETEHLLNKSVTIVGLGSFGSQIAVELAKAGVGNFYLFDFDRLESSNFSRHACDLSDIGRFKTHAIRDKIKLHNPDAKIETFEISILDKPDKLGEIIEVSDLAICATDNNPSRELIAALAKEKLKTVIYGRAFTRAFGGDVLRQTPAGPCYSCLIDIMGSTQEEVKSFKQSKVLHPAYVPQNVVAAAVQVGLSVDIQPIYNLMIKLSLLELSRGLPDNPLVALDKELSSDFYLWLNRNDPSSSYRTSPFNGKVDNANPLRIMKWIGIHVNKDAKCFNCKSEEHAEICENK
ncbi:MAG: ThiF family adenylyltransferase [Spirosomataceae bacterium]|jgi:molybdopterin/thiamine biosynthesis adenylyltransferase